jgi:putative cell wall-binding protein
MKKLLVLLAMCFLVLSSTVTYAQEKEQSNTQRVENNNGKISVRIPIGMVMYQKTSDGDEIALDDFGRHLVPGKPNLPSKIFSIAIPPGAVFVDWQYTIGEGILLPDRYDIKPVPPPQVNSIENQEIQVHLEQLFAENYQTTYSVDNAYPESVVEFERTAGFRHYNLVDIRINPLRYAPVSRTLTFYPDIMVDIHYQITEGDSSDEIVSDAGELFEQRAREIILNYEEAKEWYPLKQRGRNQYPFVILTLDSLTSCIDNLVAWEQAKGKNVQVVTISWINSQYTGYDLAEKIRNFLREKYPSEEWGIQDLLIIGHRDDIPMRETWQDVGGGHPETDFYYAELTSPDNISWDADGDHQYAENSDPIDFYGEIAVGRIPWSSEDTVAHICQKSVSYEQNTDPSFKNNILFLAGFLDENTDGATFMEYMATSTLHPWMAYWMKTRLYEFNSLFRKDYLLTHANVVDVWSKGKYAFVSWNAHGSPEGTSFISTNDCQYLNDAYPAIISAAACSNSDTAYLNIGQAMMKQGAVGFLGANKVAFYRPGWDDPSDGSDQSLKYFFKSAITSENYTQGQAHQNALTEMYIQGLWYRLRYETFIHGSLWGNPDLGMTSYYKNDRPAKPLTPDGPRRGKIRVEHTYSSSTTDVNNDALYYFFSWGDGSDSGWLGPYGSGESVEASHYWTEKNSYEIKVIAQDINGTKSVWSDPLPIDMPYIFHPHWPFLEILLKFLQKHPFLLYLLQLLIQRFQ